MKLEKNKKNDYSLEPSVVLVVAKVLLLVLFSCAAILNRNPTQLQTCYGSLLGSVDLVETHSVSAHEQNLELKPCR